MTLATLFSTFCVAFHIITGGDRYYVEFDSQLDRSN